MVDAIIHTAYENGKIRNAAGVLVAFYDAADQVLYIDGNPVPMYAADMEEAMELVGEHAPR